VLSHALKQGRCGAVDELCVCAGAPNAHSLFDRVGQSAQAVAQLARIFIGDAFAQKTADVSKRLETLRQKGARSRHKPIVLRAAKIVTAQNP
jgi:hypothetical protein